ncbi:hypothetical protein E1956_35245 [Paraburkholderia pallida]|uniref:Uncharacterized protein n=1 Tax=Paraburkholderia pallida TaxID=2547399 RepID=A0A4P7D4T4_9BURK|nr:hypothetical protein E1956_35245 [Paraburkholderia pallida]
MHARGRAYALLRQYGLRPFRARNGAKAFRGVLKCTRTSVPVHFEIDDWDFTRYPSITILERPPELPALLAHVDADGGLCYFAPQSIILDRYRPDDAIQQCLDAAIALIDDIVDGRNRGEEIVNEFAAYWTLGQNPSAWPVLVDSQPKDDEKSFYYFLTEHGKPSRGLIAKDVTSARRLVHSIDIESIEKGAFACLYFRTAVAPRIGSDPLPATIHEFFSFVRKWDPALAKEVQARLGSSKDYLKRSGCVIAIATPSGGIGVRFKHDMIRRQGYSNSPKHYRDFLHKRGGTTAITRLKLDDISPEYIHTRNLDDYPSLAEHRISLIGCGAIGGYLASALVRLGAGTGSNGVLKLYDIGELEPDNLGRHTLGFAALYQNKALGLREELLRQFPYACIEAHTNEPALTDEFFATDLVIDCTGDEAVSEKINSRHMRSRRCPVLYAWIRGNGECVQTLWVDANEKFACYRCMRQAPGPNYREERFPVIDGPPNTRFLGCRSFTPYSVSSPLSATALTIDVIIDWLKGDVAPRFRTRYVENGKARTVKNQNLSPTRACPACHPN